MVTPFRIDVPQVDLDDLRRRLDATRWPDAVADDDSQGTRPADLRRLVEYWAREYDWRATEARLNELRHVKHDGIHAITAGTKGATPLLLVHGWPDSFLRFEGALELLAERFEVVVPSIPGFGFSDRAMTALGAPGVADALAGLMTELGHEKFIVHGADIGAGISDQVAVRHPEQVLALHLGDVPLRRLRAMKPEDFTAEEREWTTKAAAWDAAEGAYNQLQRTKPQTLAASLNDSPAGLASWYLEKFTSWSDNNGNVFDTFTERELADNLTLYWVTQTAGSAARYYYDGRVTAPTDGRVSAPTGVALFPKDLLLAPRESAERWYNIKRWTRMPAGGHFGPWEQPVAWAEEMLHFADDVDL